MVMYQSKRKEPGLWSSFILTILMKISSVV